METHALIDVDPVDSYAFSEFICPICQSLARAVHQAGCCGTLFCKSCIEGWKTESSHFTCPMCRTSLYNNYFEDKSAARRIGETIVFCPNHCSASETSSQQKRCQWTGELKSVDGHLTVCDYQVIPCPNKCGVKTERFCLEKHQKRDCIHRKVRCIYCRDWFKFMDIKCHNNQCPEFLITCPNQGCILKVKRKSLKLHAISTCSLRIIVCSANCGESLPFIGQEDHLANSCIKRIVSCRHCNEEGEFAHINGKHYDSICTHVPVPCPNDGCIEKVKRGFKAEHIAVCPKQRVNCKYVEICDAEMLRENEILHYEWAREEHLTSAYSKMIHIQEEHKSEIMLLKEKVELDRTGLVERHKEKIKYYENQLQLLMEKAEFSDQLVSWFTSITCTIVTVFVIGILSHFFVK